MGKKRRRTSNQRDDTWTKGPEKPADAARRAKCAQRFENYYRQQLGLDAAREIFAASGRSPSLAICDHDEALAFLRCGRPAVAADLVRPESAVGGALRAASHSAAVVVVDGGHAPAAAFQSWLAALDGAPTLVIAFGGSRLGALRRRCGDAGVALAALREAGDATMRTTLREALMALLTGAAAPASRYDGDEAFYAPGEAALDAPDGDDGVVEEPASSPKVIEDRDAWLQNLAARAGDQEAPATPTAAAAAAAPTPESSNARSFFEGLLNSPGK